MKRHPSLHPLSQHHHFALIQALFIKRARQQPAAQRAAAVRQTARKFIRFWKKNGQQHFREEEEVLLPAYARHVRIDEDRDVVRMLAEHADIRARITALEEKLEEKLGAGAASRPADDLEADLAALGRVLEGHVRLEENHIFPRIERTLSDDELTRMGRGLTRLHRKGEVCEV